MGAGDYLMTTPLIRALHLAHPDLPIFAYASSHTDNVNSALVLRLLSVNPLIDRVFSYEGRPRSIWTDYDFSDALKAIPKDFIILPVFYEVEPLVYHRATSLLETFGLPVDLPVATPIAYQTEMTAAAERLLSLVRRKSDALSPVGIVATHFGARSSGYEYPHAANLVGRLVKLGYLVLMFSPADIQHENIVQIDISQISPTDSIELLRTLTNDETPLSMISVNSLMWPITAALNIPNLGLHTFKDPALHQYLYPNIYVVTQYANPQISPSRWFFARPTNYSLRRISDDTPFTDYKPDFVVDCFQTMVAREAA
jgi:ADP-heptose:LPS heptosyltransferase